ncbi:hypothetical protein V7161_25905 [Neobacillus drentensis]|uniref:hypothetical protein n=1 Tax=Neobacillus drentensis TaxID=220684 RepID=UPI00300253B3
MELEHKNDNYQKFISKEVFQHYSNGYDSLQVGQYFAASVWASVFLEAFLVELLNRFELSQASGNDLNSRIDRLKGASDIIPDEIHKRCHEIRSQRNRLVHDTGLGKNTLEQDAVSIYSHLEVILDWYCKKVSPFDDTGGNEPDPLDLEKDKRIPVFLSTLNPDNERQRFFLNGFKDKLKSIGIEPVQCEFGYYDWKDPLKVVRNKISECRAVIVLGLERSNAYYIKDKEGSKKESIDTHRKYTSGWLHLEAGMASAMGKEVFVLCQKDIYSDGIFDRSWNTYPVMEFKLLDEDSREFIMFFEYLNAWVKVNQEEIEKENTELEKVGK